MNSSSVRHAYEVAIRYSANPPARGDHFANSAIQQEERERKESAHEELSVVTRRHRGRDLAAHHVSQSANERAVEAVPDATQEHVGEEAGQKNVDDETPRHRYVGGHYHPQQKSG